MEYRCQEQKEFNKNTSHINWCILICHLSKWSFLFKYNIFKFKIYLLIFFKLFDCCQDMNCAFYQILMMMQMKKSTFQSVQCWKYLMEN
ncbi:unnamed protein product [Paramecium sonneborni]|uniref:Uncharacterized protein n=1 Tax=Paramecium sonneborni TaxID=65129 RepID=A0A8S1RFZ3_9CILI|nr:unnamed protein product [Paramecium sonneborni]